MLILFIVEELLLFVQYPRRRFDRTSPAKKDCTIDGKLQLVKEKSPGVSGLFWGRRLCTRKIQPPVNAEKEL
jgi:hypothetical protein